MPTDALPVFEVEGNRLTPIAGGADRLDVLLRLIDSAKRSLRLLFYIYCDDAAGRRVRDALLAARGRGVTVSLIVDGFGSDGTVPAFFAPLDQAGAEVCRFSPKWSRRYLLRNHQKLAIADEARTIVGGFNIADDYFAEGEAGWRDFGLLVEGPAARHLVRYFDLIADWTHRPKARMRELRHALRRFSQAGGRVTWLLGGPSRRLSPWARTVGGDLSRASRCTIVAAYFAPNPGMLRRVEAVARRNPANASRVITASRSDNRTTIAAARHCYGRLVRRGVAVFEYQRAKLHTKLYLIDDIVHVGSANFDMRSLFLNLELMLRIEDAAFAAHIRAYCDGEIEASRAITEQLLRERASVFDRLRWAFAYFVVATLDPVVTRRLNFGTGAEELD